MREGFRADADKAEHRSHGTMCLSLTVSSRLYSGDYMANRIGPQNRPCCCSQGMDIA